MRKVNFNLLIIIVFIFISCCNKKEKYNIQTETETIEIIKTDSIYIDTLPIISYINQDSIYIDTLPIISYINQDSIDRAELIRDSIQFRKITKKINGGYNGFEDRYNIWLRARNVLKNKNK